MESPVYYCSLIYFINRLCEHAVEGSSDVHSGPMGRVPALRAWLAAAVLSGPLPRFRGRTSVENGPPGEKAVVDKQHQTLMLLWDCWLWNPGGCENESIMMVVCREVCD